LPAELATPRRSRPRTQVPAGAVGIGGAQTGVYPLASPGGWNLIGRTDAGLFDARRVPAALLRAGDRVRFVPVDGGVMKSPERSADPVAEVAERFTHGDGQPENVCTVERAGVWTTVQDGGRRGYRAEGVPLSGACDGLALRVANLLVGNTETAPGLEVMLVGPDLTFAQDTLVALGGAETATLPAWRPRLVPAGERLRVGALTRGCRGVLAIAGGVAVARVLGSASTYARAGLGGVHGREVRAGDRLPLGGATPVNVGPWSVDPRMLPRYGADVTVRVVPGAQAEEFGEAGWETEFRISAQSDRMGVRLQGPALARRSGGELASSPVAPGTVQVPPDGQPIVLLADAQTIGGYPQWAHVVAVDLPVMAQLRPGDRVRFRPVTAAEARALARAQERAIGLLREGLARVQR
jgi:antagonist of KipI